MSKLKNVKKAIIGLFTILLFFSFFSHNAMSATTIGDTTFSADVGKTYTWKYTYPATMKGTKLTYTIESIEKGVHNTIDALMVYCTIISGSLTIQNNSLYLAANNTQNYLAFVNFAVIPVMIPTPINLTLVAKASFAYNYSIVDNTIILNYDGGYSEEITFNTNGFLTEGIYGGGGVSEMRFVLATSEAAVPFGNYFLVFMVIGVIALIYLKKQKIR